MSVRVPSYRLHKPTRQAVVTICGKDVYLGRHGSEASHDEYRRDISEWMVTGSAPAVPDAPATVNEVMVPYIRHANAYYVKNGVPTSEANLIRLSLKVLKRTHGHTPAAEFGPLALKAVRQQFVEAGLCRREVNRRTGLVVRFFKWAVENELVPPSVHHGLATVTGLRKGRTAVRESKPVGTIDDSLVDAVEPFLSPQVRDMVRLQRVTGMRPGEVVLMRSGDIDRAGEVWTFVPMTHKTEHHAIRRTVYLGPKARAILLPWLRADPTAFLFRPRDVIADIQADRRKLRKTRVQPSQHDRSKHSLRKTPGDRYTVNSYRRAIAVGCAKAGVPPFAPNRLRHNAATAIRRDFGLDAARVILGHTSPAVTETYAEPDRAKALTIMGQVG